MNRLDFTPYRRTTVGFDRLFDLLERQARINAGDNYPPFNIERQGEDAYRITLALAGFAPEDIGTVRIPRKLLSGCLCNSIGLASARYGNRG